MSNGGTRRVVRRVVQWTTGNVARETVRAVLARPDLELVGVYAHSPAKVGKDVAELCGLGPEPGPDGPHTAHTAHTAHTPHAPHAPLGIAATDDVAALLATKPDCVVYTPLHFDVDEVATLLTAGVNVVTTAEFLTGRSLDGDQRRRLADAATAGGATLFGSGMNPGYAQLLAAVASGVCTDVRKVTVTESVDVSLFAGDANMDALGWGRPAGDPGHAAAVEQATVVFADGVDVLAALVGLDPGAVDVRCHVAFAHATRDLDLPGRPIGEGTVAGIDLRWEGVVGGRAAVELHQRWLMGTDLDPPWTVEHAYLVEVDADPQVRLRFEIRPDQDLRTLTTEGIHAIGMRITGLPIVNAIPAVCEAPPGILTYADLPTVAGAGKVVA